ncbi:HD domain-containing protein [Methanothermococcus okinawensis]|uniref:Metal dependent phosphohydrolase n=1 Tax=Methanothermococcus okinawensis (strain DSM 14208 / JCM 11175 / IH1) TaxID=647113 RepID=F8ALB4_METOI|nr:HD domain-containing protein [Methanothermococcus okinawensis]AEH06502.1 metal dependent phosphohydrolase [Methanothermococcus okinawensis IH1]
MSEIKIIRDPIYADIPLNGSELSLIDTPEFQRLRNIKQTGLTCMVYPSANHTRFEHSIGTMHVAGEISKNLEDVDRELIRIAALLHDIGHPPFSHTLEICGYNHEYITRKKIKKMDFESYTPNEVIDVLQSKGFEGALLSGDVDADRMDYLLRDSYHTGVAYGSIDYARLIRCMVLLDDIRPKLGVLGKGLIAVESLLIARYQMYPTVYMHPTSRIAEIMLKNATIYGLNEKLFNLNDLSTMDDIDLVATLRRSSDEECNKLIKMLDKRHLFKNILTFRYDDLTPEEKWLLINLNEEDVKQLEMELSEKLGTTVFLDIPDYPKINEHNVTVIIDNKRYKLDEISPLAKNLKWAYMKSWDVRVYIPPEHYKLLKNENKFKENNKKEVIFDCIRKKHKKSMMLDIMQNEGVIKGRGRLLTIAKEMGMSESEFLSELQKLIFCGLIKENVVKVRGTYRYDYAINL